MGYVKAGGRRPRSSWRLPTAYHPPLGKPLLVLLPCARRKPYSESPFHIAVAAALRDCEREVHFCTISEEVGIVPRELERSIPDYDTYPDEGGVARAAAALSDYISRYGHHYSSGFAYATSRTFRTIVKRGTAGSRLGVVLIPRDGSFSKRSAFFEFMRCRAELRAQVMARSNGSYGRNSKART